MAERFEDLKVWQKAKQLSLAVYRESHSGQLSQDRGFKDQIQRAAVSVMNNIAEGFERKSRKDFARFLLIAKGSAGEVRSMLYLALELKYIEKESFDEMLALTQECSKMISGLVKSLQSN